MNNNVQKAPPKLNVIAYMRPFLFAVNKDTRKEFNSAFDSYVCCYDEMLGELLLSKSRSLAIQKCTDTVQYYFIHALEYSAKDRIDYWRNVRTDRLSKSMWECYCKDYGVQIVPGIEEVGSATTSTGGNVIMYKIITVSNYVTDEYKKAMRSLIKYLGEGGAISIECSYVDTQDVMYYCVGVASDEVDKMLTVLSYADAIVCEGQYATSEDVYAELSGRGEIIQVNSSDVNDVLTGRVYMILRNNGVDMPVDKVISGLPEGAIDLDKEALTAAVLAYITY